MPDPFYATLYVDSDEKIEELQEFLQRIPDLFQGLQVELIVFKNDKFEQEARLRAPYDFIKSSRYYLEVGGIDGGIEKLFDFRAGVASLVRNLRDARRFVTASCIFDDYIAEATGWNWTKDNPEPPGRSIT